VEVIVGLVMEVVGAQTAVLHYLRFQLGIRKQKFELRDRMKASNFKPRFICFIYF
jgi:hypothetical protein